MMMARAAVSELTVPLRGAWNITRYKRAPRALKIIRREVIRHLKVDEEEEVWIDPAVNEHIWTRGIENPPRKVKLQITRHDEPDIPIEVKLVEE
jgi:large subunit ribosomal protein L31e